MMTGRELADAIGVSNPTIYAWVKRGWLTPSFRVGRSVAFDEAAIAVAVALRDSDKGGRLAVYEPMPADADEADFEPIADAAARLGVSMFTVRRWVKAGHDAEGRPVVAFRQGRQAIMMRRSDVDELIQARADDEAEAAGWAGGELRGDVAAA